MGDHDLVEMRVLDISQQLPGPYASALLADLGASVTKVESPSGDPSRELDPSMFALINSGKPVVTIDLKTARGVGKLHDLVATSDVFIEGFRPGVASRLGAGYDTLSSINPQLVYCSISACGQTGPYATTPMHDLNLQGLAGVDTGVGSGIGVPWVDLGTATTCALAVVAAWHNARRSGIGRYLDLAMLDVAVLWGRVKAAAVHRDEPTYGIFDTADGRQVAVAILEDHIWTRLCVAFGWFDWEADRRYARYEARVERAREVSERLADACAACSQADLVALAGKHDLPITPVRAATGTPAAAQLAGRELASSSARRTPLPVTHRSDRWR